MANSHPRVIRTRPLKIFPHVLFGSLQRHSYTPYGLLLYTVQVQQQTTEQRISHSVLRVLEQKGPEAVSMRRIAGLAGITPMAIYHHFPNRETLLRSVVDREFEKLLRLIQNTRTTGSFERDIIHIMDSYIDYAFERPYIFDYVFSKPRPDARRFPRISVLGVLPP